ncbi:hypothetical protein F0562_028046 [Nyssa sinensis]|uniref:J domain-containing protein n=1 Tax=Nyssa sinensis TaxID=561372 RepID=A0A5J5B6Y6_9ASTE|nr:hypothetical protein F0562_028046 [Nyssa sinensis]
MADLKGKSNSNNGVSRNFGINSGFDNKPSSTNRSKSEYNSNSVAGSFVGDLGGNFRSNNNQKTKNYGGWDGYDDVFGRPIENPKPSDSRLGGDGGLTFGFDSIFKGSNNFGAKSPTSHLYDDDDIFGSLMKSSVSFEENSGEVETNAREFDDLIPGFGGSSLPKNESNPDTRQPQKSTNLAEDPFVVLESSSSPSYTSGLFPGPSKKDTGKNSVPSSIDDLEDFAMGRMWNKSNKQSDVLFGDVEIETSVAARKEATYGAEAKKREHRGAFGSENDLESFFSIGAQPSSVPRSSAKTVDPVYDTLFQNRAPEVARPSSRTSSSAKKAPSVTNIVDDFSFFFGAAPSSGQFQEIEGETEERRRARLNHHLKTQARMAKALAEKNQRDFQTQQEQEERHRIAESLNDDIKRWAAGKEGNLRALLSSLQYVLWPDCGWQPVSLTDLITSVSVKKVYYKATLCVHPDKVQQKGANLQQKYIAEKVFDLLKVPS